MAHDWKSCWVLQPSRVQIPHPPPPDQHKYWFHDHRGRRGSLQLASPAQLLAFSAWYGGTTSCHREWSASSRLMTIRCRCSLIISRS